MARAIWSGSISFGLVNIPVKLYTAVSRKNVAFHQIDSRTGSRIKQRRVSAVDGEEVPYDQIVKGYELSSGEYVTISDEELSALDPEAVRTIDIEEFVDLADIDPIYYDAAYYLVPDATTAKPYKLLATAMEQAQKVGIARFVMRTKQYVAAVRPKDGKLLLSTMVYDDEVVKPDEIGGFDVLEKVDVGDREVAMAEQLIDSLAEEFEPSKHHDTYREAVLELIERKAAGEAEVLPAPTAPAAEKVIDLMAALEASVAAAKEARGRHPSSRADDSGTAGGGRARKPAAKKAASGKGGGAEDQDGEAAAQKPAARKRKSA
jgi:DNA end-binding protein Ku